MSMFGYGYNLDTNLLAALTELGGGCFGYIPDCSMIGTIFVNFLSAALASYSPKLQAKIELKHGHLKDFSGSNKNYVNLGSIQYGVTRNCLIRFKGKPHEEELGEVILYFEESAREKTHIKLNNKFEKNEENIKIQNARIEHIHVLQKALDLSKTDLKHAGEIVKAHL